MEINKSRKIVLIALSVLVILVTITIVYIFILNRPNTYLVPGQINSYPISLPVSFSSYPRVEKSTQSNPETNISFVLRRPSIDEKNPYTNQYVNFNSFSSDPNIKMKNINPGSELIYSENFYFLALVSGEGLPIGLDTPIPESFEVNNNFNKTIFRVEYSKDIDLKSLFDIYGGKVQIRYFYSDDFRKGVDCGPDFKDYFCGGATITLNRLANGDKPSIRLYCGVNDKTNIKYCDEFVRNLVVEVKEVHNK